MLSNEEWILLVQRKCLIAIALVYKAAPSNRWAMKLPSS